MRKPSHAGASRGFTLIEALVALSLLSIITGMAWSFYLFAHKQVLVRESKAFEFDNTFSLMRAIAANIRQCRATLRLDETEWVFISKDGDTARYAFAGDTLKFNALPLVIPGKKIARFYFSCSGNDSTLDANGDDSVSFEELDVNGDRCIDGPETESIAWITASITLEADREKPVETVESVRNFLEYDEVGYQTYFKE